MSKHTFFVTGEAGVPDAIKNASGEVVLRQCRACDQGEGELTDECPMFGIEPWRNERDRYNGDYADYKHADDEIAALRRALAEQSEKLQRATDALRKVKLRLHFLGMPGESMWKVDDHFTWVPDWRYEIQLIENALHGSPITTPEKPTDVRNRIDVTFVTEQVDLQENGEPLYTRRAIATWPEWASKIFYPPEPPKAIDIKVVDGEVTFEQVKRAFLDIKNHYNLESAKAALAETGYASIVQIPQSAYRRAYDIAISHQKKLKESAP